jgi:hypothetical protein
VADTRKTPVVIVPIVTMEGDFGDAGAELKDNGYGLGDSVTGA